MDFITIGTPNDYPRFWKRVFLLTFPISVSLLIAYWLLLMAVVFPLSWGIHFGQCCRDFWRGEDWDWERYR